MSRIVTILVGSGAVIGAWDPVIDALKSAGFKNATTADHANFAMAMLVYTARLATTVEGPDADATIRAFETTKEAIATKLTEAMAQDKLSIRPSFASVIEHFIHKSDATMGGVVTTNWDGIVEREANRLAGGAPVSYVHGNITNSGQLYLPTEFAKEPYRKESDNKALEEIHFRLAGAIGQSNILVIYGLSLSPLDVELATVLWRGAQDDALQEIHVVDPRFEEVALRLSQIPRIGTKDRPIFCYDPQHISWPPARLVIDGKVMKAP